jgi:hypothetical protein
MGSIRRRPDFDRIRGPDDLGREQALRTRSRMTAINSFGMISLIPAVLQIAPKSYIRAGAGSILVCTSCFWGVCLPSLGSPVEDRRQVQTTIAPRKLIATIAISNPNLRRWLGPRQARSQWSPPFLGEAIAVADAQHDRMLVFGGTAGPPFNPHSPRLSPVTLGSIAELSKTSRLHFLQHRVRRRPLRYGLMQ